MLTAAALCPAPPLLARELTGADPVVPELRQACREAADALVQAGPHLIAVVGVGAATLAFEPDGQLDVTGYAPGIAARPARAVPLPLGLGSRLLDEAGYDGRRELHSVAADETAQACAALGARLASAAERVALMVMADGSARRTRRAPGYLDERSVPFDDEVSRAVRDGDLSALLVLDAALAAELLATGRPAWQVLAGAAGSSRPSCMIRYEDDPFGVAYLVASLTVG